MKTIETKINQYEQKHGRVFLISIVVFMFMVMTGFTSILCLDYLAAQFGEWMAIPVVGWFLLLAGIEWFLIKILGNYNKRIKKLEIKRGYRLSGEYKILLDKKGNETTRIKGKTVFRNSES